MARSVYLPFAFFSTLLLLIFGSLLWVFCPSLQEDALLFWVLISLFSLLAGLLVGGLSALLYHLYFRKAKHLFEQSEAFVDVGRPFPTYEDPKLLLLYLGNLLEDVSLGRRKARNTHEIDAFLLEHMRQGYLLLDEKLVVLGDNELAEHYLLRPSLLGLSLFRLNLGEKADKRLRALQEGDLSSFDVSLGDRTYLFIPGEGKFEGKVRYALFLVDVSENRLNAKIRREFFQNASHELKSPLTSILGYQELIAAGILDEKDKKAAERSTLSAAKRMKGIIEGMFTLFSIEASEKGEKEEIHVKTLFESLLDEKKGALQKDRLSVQKDLEDVMILGNRRSLSMIFENLLSNAIKYNNPGGTIKVCLTKDGFSVSDNGIGIREEDLPRIFERFYVADRSRSPEKGSTGLGLAIVKHLCLNEGYDIEVESVYNRGTRFTVYFKKKAPSSKAKAKGKASPKKALPLSE